MRIAVVGKARKKNSLLEKAFSRSGFIIDRKNPDMVICYGGDGTFLFNERRYPGIPKLLMRGKNICRLCDSLSNKGMISRLKEGRYKVVEFPKLEARLGKKRFLCANDFVVRNAHPARALRFRVKVNNQPLGLMIGDGVVVSTPFGSTGYYSSIARKSFKRGIGIAFNNTVEKVEHLVLPEDSVITVRADRDTAQFTADNEQRIHSIAKGGSVSIRKSKKKIRIIRLQ